MAFFCCYNNISENALRNWIWGSREKTQTKKECRLEEAISVFENSKLPETEPRASVAVQIGISFGCFEVQNVEEGDGKQRVFMIWKIT